MRFRRAVGLVLLGILGITVGRVWVVHYRFNYVRRHRSSIRVGDTRAVVIEKLGKPNYHDGTCLEDLRVSKHCVSELVYSEAFAPFLPSYYVVDLSEQGRVVAAGRVDSP